MEVAVGHFATSAVVSAASVACLAIACLTTGSSCSSASSPTMPGAGVGAGSGGSGGGGASGSGSQAGQAGQGSSQSSGSGASSSGGGDASQGGSSSGAPGGSSGANGVPDEGGAAQATAPSHAGGGGSDPTMLPKATGTCPSMSGLNGTNVSFAGQDFTVWSGDPSKGPGPLLVYWYATGSNSMEPTWSIQGPQIQKIVNAGGAVVAMVKTAKMGNTTGNNVWYTGDVAAADEAVACAIQTQKIDVRRIWSAGYSAGALQTVYMWYARSGYLSGVISYSGGDISINRVPLQDSTHLPVALASHGAMGKDVVTVDFNQASHAWETNNSKAFIVDCDDGGNHVDTMPRTAMAPEAIQMLWDHPFGVSPEPYVAGLPSGWPTDCVPPPVPAGH